MITEMIQKLACFRLTVLMISLLLGGCATLVLDRYDTVEFVNIPRKTSLKTRYGQGFSTIEGGVEYVSMRRSNNVSAQVRCGGGRAITAKLSTKPEIAFLLGNLFIAFPFGHIIDVINQRAWGYDQPVDVGAICAPHMVMKPSKIMSSCRANLQCIRKKVLPVVADACIKSIKSEALNDYRWVENPNSNANIHAEKAFPYVAWEAKSTGDIKFSGDGIELQSGAGGWTRYRYFCIVNLHTGKILSVEMVKGRFR